MRRVLDYVRGRKGKMMRPILVLLLAKELGAIAEPTLHAAVSLELLHTSSLIHDDVVDESEERRRKSQCKKGLRQQSSGAPRRLHAGQNPKPVGYDGAHRHCRCRGAPRCDVGRGRNFAALARRTRKFRRKPPISTSIHRKTGALFEACGELAALSMHADAEFLAGGHALWAV